MSLKFSTMSFKLTLLISLAWLISVNLVNTAITNSSVVIETEQLTNEQLNELIKNLAEFQNLTHCGLSEECASKWMKEYDYVLGKISNKEQVVEFQFDTNITDFNQKLVDELIPIRNRFNLVAKKEISKFTQNTNIQNASLVRMFKLASREIVNENETEAEEISNLINTLTSIYGTAKVCKQDKECLSLEPELSNILRDSTDYDELYWAWKGWHDATGPKMKEIFKKTVLLKNNEAQQNGYKDLSEKWIENFETDNFEQLLDNLFSEIKPVYDLLHTYVRNKLDKVYSSKYHADHNPKLIQAHLLGNMWAQDWSNIFDLVVPYPNVSQINVTKALVEKNYTTDTLFKEAEKFFVSLGLFEMTPTFWNKSMFLKPTDREVLCHASAWNFYNGYDYRIKMCTQIDDKYYSTVHHEMGHVEYYMSYENQPNIYKEGANPAFHESIGNTISLSVQTPNHLHRVGLIEIGKISYEQIINSLMKVALRKIAALPFMYVVDKWRWAVLRGNINETEYNKVWWQMRQEYQGLESPELRNETYFDPGAKYHIAVFKSYAMYFFGVLHEFQFHKTLCDLSGNTEPLHNCDIYGSKTAGTKFREMLELGRSKHWLDALNQLTGETKVTTKPVIEYFQPLIDWLKKENQKN